ncbi:hypothetical protein BCAR13_80154 [Paraburkholderia caribensis]|nr:hypothetical protein BCAR13_80154 [Paraburkholderia caribensis]
MEQEDALFGQFRIYDQTYPLLIVIDESKGT